MTTILLILSIMIALPIVVLAIEVLAACAPRHSAKLSTCHLPLSTELSPSPRPRVSASSAPSASPALPLTPSSSSRLAVLIPAHNEEVGIVRTIESIRPQLNESDRLLVIADNCTDATAQVARVAGAEVLERMDATNRGKGFALAYGMEHLAVDPPTVLAVIDADMRLESGTLEAMRAAVAATSRPVQAVDLLMPPEGATAKALISAFAFAFKNHVRTLGADRLRIPCLLRGTGMAFPWAVISKANLATGNIVEDMQLGIDLAIAGHPPVFCPDARVTGQLPDQSSAATTQRTRWEHGHLQTIRRNVPRLVWEAIRQRRPSLFALALDLAVPPLALLVVLWAAVLAGSAAAVVFGASSLLPIYLSLASGSLLVASILLAWARFARNILPARSLLMVPLYILWKLPLYAAYVIRPQKAWVRTAR